MRSTSVLPLAPNATKLNGLRGALMPDPPSDTGGEAPPAAKAPEAAANPNPQTMTSIARRTAVLLSKAILTRYTDAGPTRGPAARAAMMYGWRSRNSSKAPNDRAESRVGAV